VQFGLTLAEMGSPEASRAGMMMDAVAGAGIEGRKEP
jgi:hypothetical protein